MNNNQIDNTDYYRLPCGKYLEDFIAMAKLDFAIGSALKYTWRAGKKDGESSDKDIAKARHYINFIANRENGNDPMKPMEVEFRIDMLVSAAKTWDGKER